MKYLVTFAFIAIVGFIGYSYVTSQRSETKAVSSAEQQMSSVTVQPISHATMVLIMGNTVVYTDPVDGKDAFVGQPAPNLVLITDIHGDHLNVETLEGVITDATTIIAPQAVYEMLPATLQLKTEVLTNGEGTVFADIDVEAIPMYNLPETEDARHAKGRGNGYVLTYGADRVYIAGDTAGIPEMRALTGITLAFVPMNLPYTMSVEEAAEAVLAFAPKKVYPYHYRGQEGLSDVQRFKELVDAGGKDIEVVLLDWYPSAQ